MSLARERAHELAAQDRELHFSAEGDGHVVIELRTLAGRPVRRIPLALALDIIHGADLAIALESLGPDDRS